MVIKIIVLITLVTTATGPAVFAQESKWVSETKKTDIQVYSRAKPGTERKDFRTVTQVNTPAGHAASIIENAADSDQWMYLLSTVDVIRDPKSGKKVYYFHWDIPFPFPDRDAACFREEFHENDGSVRFQYRSAPEAYPEQEDRVRIADFGCDWEIIPKGERRSEITLELRLASDGVLPAWFVNWLTKKISVESMRELGATITDTNTKAANEAATN